MAKAAAPTITAQWVSDSNIHLTVVPTAGHKIQIARWNQYDQLYGTATGNDGGWNGPSPGTTTAGRLYKWRARARKLDNSNDWSNWTESNYIQTTPTAPTDAAVGLSGPTAASVTWTNTVNTPWDNYTTEVWWDVNSAGMSLLTTVGPGVGSHYVDGLTAGTTYRFLVKHLGQVEPNLASADSNVTATVKPIAVPAAPTGLTATRDTDGHASLSWTNNSSAAAPYDSLTLQRWSAARNAWATIVNLASGALSASDVGIAAGNKYQYRIAANNSVGSSNWTYSDTIFTSPKAVVNVSAAYTGGTSVSVTWANKAYAEHTLRVQPYKDGVADGAVVSLAAGVTSYTKTAVDVLASYVFNVWAVSDVGALSSPVTASNTVDPAQPPSAPTGLASSAPVVDITRAHSISWTHSPSIDGSAQTKRQLRHRLLGAAAWVEEVVVTTTAMTIADLWTGLGYFNGDTIEWQVRTYGVHADPSLWSATSTVTTSTTPTVNITAPEATVANSNINVAWSYFDAQNTVQSEWKVELYESVSNALVGSETASSAATSVTVATQAVDGLTYRVEVSVRDASGLWSDTAQKTFDAAFTPPAEVLLDIELDGLSGSGVLTLTPTADDGGATTLPASAVTVERRFYDDEIEAYGPWEVLAREIDPAAVLIDTTAPAHDDGQYRVTTHSAAPSSFESNTLIKPLATDHRWLYVSGGNQFGVVCKMWANIKIDQKASRSRALHYFAGRKNPVLYTGESAERTFSVTGILEDEASPPQQWMRLAREAGPVLLRAPGRRMFGNLSEVSVSRLGPGLHSVSFSIQEVGV